MRILHSMVMLLFILNGLQNNSYSMFKKFTHLITNPAFNAYASKNIIRSLVESGGPRITKEVIDYTISQASDFKQYENKYGEIIQTIAAHTSITNNSDALFSSVKNNLQLITKILLENKVKIDRDENFRTPLHHVKNIEIADLLIKNGVSVNNQDFYGNTPLHYVPAELVSLLIKNNGNSSLKNKTSFEVIKILEQTLTDREKKVLTIAGIGSVSLLYYALCYDPLLMLPTSYCSIPVLAGYMGYFMYRGNKKYIQNGLTPIMKSIVEGDQTKFQALRLYSPSDDIKVWRDIAQGQSFYALNLATRESCQEIFKILEPKNFSFQTFKMSITKYK